MTVTRLTGMATGMDTDATIKQMMKPYQMRVDKVKQDRQVVQWKQDLYRDILTDVNNFKSTYFDVLRSDTYMLSQNSYAGFDITTNGGNSTATASVDAKAGTYELSNITLATSAKKSGNIINIKQADNSITVPATIDGTNKGLNIKIGQTNYRINISEGTYNTIDDLKAAINTAFASDATVNNNIEATVLNGKIQFSSKSTNTINISDSTNSTALNSFGFTATNFELNQSTSDKMSNIFNGITNFTIQVGSSAAVNFSYDFSNTGADKDKSISTILNDISQKTGLDVSYNQLGKNFSITSKMTGSDQTISLKDSAGSFLDKILGNDPAKNIQQEGVISGTDATVTIKDPEGVAATVTKGTNSFTIDGMNYTLNGTTNTNITVTTNTQNTFDKIKGFVDKYNELIDKLEKKVNEKKQYTYKPLTEDQKKEMKEDEIKTWEEKAKEGLLKGDSNLQKMLLDLRGAIYGSVDGSLITEIGISTSSDISKRGKLEINESKLKEALKTNPEKVSSIFVKKSNTVPSYSPDLSDADRKTRWNEQGVFSRFEDIFKDYTRLTRNKDGNKGVLIEKAGIKGDLSEFKNLLSKDLDDQDKVIRDMERKLADRENKYYLQFAQLEKAMNQMNSQSSWLAQQLGGGQ